MGSQKDTTERLSVHTHPNRPESLYWEQLFLIKNCCFWSIGQHEFWGPCLMAPDVCSSFFFFFSLKPLLANIPPSLSPLSFSKIFFFLSLFLELNWSYHVTMIEFSRSKIWEEQVKESVWDLLPKRHLNLWKFLLFHIQIPQSKRKAYVRLKVLSYPFPREG